MTPLRLLVIPLALLPAGLLAWHDGGHMTVAEIAWRHMSPKARTTAMRLLRDGGQPKNNTFVTASCWADDNKTPQNGPWHYLDHFFRADGKPTDLKPDHENAVWALEKFSKELKDSRAPEAAKGDALRFILHIVGDLHQPLHCVARVTDEYPKGDRGGNDFRVVSPEGMNPRPRNLHFYWDMAGGLFTGVARPLNAEHMATVIAWADQAEAALPLSKNDKAAQNLDFMSWTYEGFDLCKKIVYDLPIGTVPSDTYQARCQKLSLERCALAGYRLGNLLNKLIG